MSHDGCKEVAWRGHAFPYLIHHPNAYLKTEHYGSDRQTEASSGHETSNGAGDASKSQAATGTWNGPAPRGLVSSGGASGTAATAGSVASERQVDYVRVGADAVRMPLLGLGTYSVTDPDTIKVALRLGYRHFDCASFYGNQAVVGAGLRDFIQGGHREELTLVSKIWLTERRPDAVRASCETSIAQLGCKYLDQLLIHWPEAALPEWKAGEPLLPDTSVTVLDTWRAMEALVNDGLVRTLGVSNFGLKEIEELLAQSRIRPAVNQIELHPLLPQRKLVGTCFRKGVQCVAYSPLGGQGAGGAASTLWTHPSVLQVAQETGKTPAQVLLRWNMQRGVPVIPKASSEAHLRENIEGAFEWRLSPQHKALLDSMENGTRFVLASWHTWPDPEEGGAVKPSLVIS